MLADGMISESDLHLITLTDSVDEAVALVERQRAYEEESISPP